MSDGMAPSSFVLHTSFGCEDGLKSERIVIRFTIISEIQTGISRCIF